MTVCESYLRFTLPEGSRHHEEVNPADTGVDLEIASDPPCWLEVKNWDAPVIPPDQRPIVRIDFANKTNSESNFWSSIQRKFEGTSECLSKRGEHPSFVRLILLLECSLMNSISLAPMNSLLERHLQGSDQLSRFPVVVTRIAGFHQLFGPNSLTSCRVTPYPDCICLSPVDRCSALKRRHQEAS